MLFHHVMGDTGGARGVWAYVEGGMGRLSAAIADAAREAGAEIRTESPVASVSVKGGRAVGVVLEAAKDDDLVLVLLLELFQTLRRERQLAVVDSCP